MGKKPGVISFLVWINQQEIYHCCLTCRKHKKGWGPISTMEVKRSPAGGGVLRGSQVTQQSKCGIHVHTCVLHRNVPSEINLKKYQNSFHNNCTIIKIAMIQYIHKKRWGGGGSSLIITTPLLKMYTQKNVGVSNGTTRPTFNWIRPEETEKKRRWNRFRSPE